MVLSTILSSLALSSESWTPPAAAAAAAAAAAGWLAREVEVETYSPGISYRTLGWDFLFRRKVSFHQPADGSAMMGDRDRERDREREEGGDLVRPSRGCGE